MFDPDRLAAGIVAGSAVPLSFRIGHQPARFQVGQTRPDGAGWITAFQVEDHPLRLHVRHERLHDPEVLRVEGWITATGGMTAALGTVRILDLLGEHADRQAMSHLRWSTGGTPRHGVHDHYQPVLFRPTDLALRGFEEFTAGDDTGRGSNEVLPIWAYAADGRSCWFAPEWQGTWRLRVARVPERTAVWIELPHLHAVLHQGEEVRLPAVAIGSGGVDLDSAANAVRRAISRHYLPQRDGRPPQPRAIYQTLGAHPDEMHGDGLRDEADRALACGVRQFVFSSFWNFPKLAERQGRQWWHLMGGNRPDPGRFAPGVAHLVQRLRAGGCGLGLWIDPRFGCDHAQYELAQDVQVRSPQAWHGELEKSYNQLSEDINIQPLIDLACAAGRRYLAGELERMVVEYQADAIWYDLNTDPRRCHFDPNEEPDRRGLWELRYFQGMDAVMGAFVRRHPQVWVEMCASGGRMINLAVLRYAHSLWISDYTGHDADQAWSIRRGASTFLPAVLCHQSVYLSPGQAEGRVPVPPRALVAHALGCFGISQGLWALAPSSLAALADFSRRWGAVSELLDGDFAALASWPATTDTWDAWQTAGGLIAVLALKDCTERTVRLHPRWHLGAPVTVLAGDATATWEAGELVVRLGDDGVAFMRCG